MRRTVRVEREQVRGVGELRQRVAEQLLEDHQIGLQIPGLRAAGARWTAIRPARRHRQREAVLHRVIIVGVSVIARCRYFQVVVGVGVLRPFGVAAQLVQRIGRFVHPRQERQAVFIEEEPRHVEVEPRLMPGADEQQPRGADLAGIEDGLRRSPRWGRQRP